MTPKEKAQDLVDKFIQTNGNAFFAKECALIAVDEIMESIKILPMGMDYLSWRDYWKEVKQEIEKI